MNKNKPVPLGTNIPPWGVVSAIHSRGGERSYFFQKGNATTLMPAELVENKYYEQES